MDLALQVRELSQRNVELQSALLAKERDMESLRDLPDAMQSQDVQAAKFIELSKKVRTLNLSLEKEKARNAKLQADLAAGSGGGGASPFAGLPAQAVEDVARSVVEQAAGAVDAANKETSVWRERHQQQTNKVAQMEQRVFAAEAEAKKLSRALAREVGEEVPLAKVLDESSDWKGRREQITALRDQVKVLRAAAGTAVDSKREAGAKSAIQKISSGRSQEMERVAADLATAQAEVEVQRSRADGAISRRKILEKEIQDMKAKVAVVLDKSNNDDRLIAALRTEVASLRKAQAQANPGKFGSAGAPGASEDEIWLEVSALRRRCLEQEKQVARQEQIILTLQRQ